MFVIYRAINKINGHDYIGVSGAFPKRRRNHIAKAKAGSPYPFHKAIQKYGSDAFAWDFLETLDDGEAAKAAEIYWIKRLRPYYNMTDGGQGTTGLRLTEEQRRKIGDASRGRSLSEETRHKISVANSGKTPSAETRVKISAAGKGRIPSAETLAKMKATRLENGGYGKSEETRRKMSIAMSGKKQSPETIEKRAAKLRGRTPPPGTTDALMAYNAKPRSPEHCAAISRAKMGKKLSAETRAKMSAAHKARNNCDVSSA